MAILNTLRGMITRRKSVPLDLAQSGANEGRATTAVETKPNAIAERGPARAGARNPSAQDIMAASPPTSIEEVMSLVRQISGHLEKQAARTDRLVECMQRLPSALDALPEINRQNARLFEIVNEYLDHSRRRDDALNETLHGITNASHRQTDVLGLLQQQMDSSTRTSEQLLSSLGEFREAIGNLAGSNARTTDILSQLNRTSELREHELTQMLGRTQRWMIAAITCCAAMSLSAIILAAIASFT